MGKDLKGRELGQGISQRRNGDYCARYTNRYGKRRSIYRKKLGELRLALSEGVYIDKTADTTIVEEIILDDWFEKWLKVFKSNLNEAAVDNHYAVINPAKKIKTPKDTAAKQIHALTQQEQKTFLQFSKGRFYHNAYLFQLYTGVRPGELFALKTEDVDFKERTISIRKTLLY